MSFKWTKIIPWIKQYFRDISNELEERRLQKLTFQYYLARTKTQK